MKDGMRIEMDFHKVRATMTEVMDFVNREMAAHPDREYYMSGNYYAIVSVPKFEPREVN